MNFQNLNVRKKSQLFENFGLFKKNQSTII